jgi:hypothetical protein
MEFVAPGGVEFRAGTPITDEHRRWLERRAEIIDSFQNDRRPDRAVAIVSTLLTAFPHREMSEGAALMKIAAFRIALDDAPTWAVEEAAKRWTRDETLGNGFAPTPPQLRAVVDHLVKVAKGRAIHMRKLAAMTVEHEISAEQRERIATLNFKLTRTPDAQAIRDKALADVGDKKTRTTAQGANAA